MKTKTVCLCTLLLASLSPSVTHAAIIVVDNFQNATVGQALGAVPGWTQNTHSNLTMDIVADPAEAANKVLRVRTAGTIDNLAGAWISTGSGISSSSTAATLFFQMRFAADSGNNRAFAGLSAATPAQLAVSNSFGQSAAYAGGITGSGTFGAGSGGSTLNTGNPAANTWYNVWLVVNNNAQTYDVYVNSGAQAAVGGDRLWDNITFRTAEGLPGTLDKIMVFATSNSTGDVYLDNFTLDDAAANLDYQLIPEPATTASLAGLLALAILLRRRHSRM